MRTALTSNANSSAARVNSPSSAVPEMARKYRMAADDRHRQLLRVAIDVFSRHGFGGTKTKDIAAAAGVSEAILFRHFATKEDLYTEILDTKVNRVASESVRRHVQECVAGRDDYGVFATIARHVLQSFKEDAAFHRLIFHALLEGHIMAHLFQQRMGGCNLNLGNYIAQRQRDGVFRQADAMLLQEFALGSIVHFAMRRNLFGIGKRRPLSEGVDVAAEVTKFILGGLYAPSYQPAGAIAPKRRQVKKGKTIYGKS